MTTNKAEPFRVRGRVVDADSVAAVQGRRIEAWDKDLIVDDFFGDAPSGADGTGC